MSLAEPGPDIGASCSIAVTGRTEFSIPVVRSGKAGSGLGRLLCSVRSHWDFGGGRLVRAVRSRSTVRRDRPVRFPFPSFTVALSKAGMQRYAFSSFLRLSHGG